MDTLNCTKQQILIIRSVDMISGQVIHVMQLDDERARCDSFRKRTYFDCTPAITNSPPAPKIMSSNLLDSRIEIVVI